MTSKDQAIAERLVQAMRAGEAGATSSSFHPLESFDESSSPPLRRTLSKQPAPPRAVKRARPLTDSEAETSDEGEDVTAEEAASLWDLVAGQDPWSDDKSVKSDGLQCVCDSLILHPAADRTKLATYKEARKVALPIFKQLSDSKKTSVLFMAVARLLCNLEALVIESI